MPLARPRRTLWSALLALVSLGCSAESEPEDVGPSPQQADVSPPVLSHAIVDLEGSYDPATGALGALRCPQLQSPDADAAAAGGDGAAPCVRPFGGLVPDTDPVPGFLSFLTQAGASVFSAAPGIVTDVAEQPGAPGAFGLRIRLSEDSPFWLEYGDVAEPAVTVGQTVEPGVVLGTAVADAATADLGRAAFAVVRDQEVYQRLCPARYADAPLSQRLDTARLASGIEKLCTTVSLLCPSPPCNTAADYHRLEGDVDRGRAVYQQVCARCHGRSGQRMHGCEPFCWHSAVASKIVTYEMPPQGEKCVDTCADDVAAYLLHEIFPHHQH